MLLIAVLFAAAAARLAVRAAMMRRTNSARAVARVGAYGHARGVSPEREARPDRVSRLVEQMPNGLGRRIRRRLLGASEEEVRARLHGAGLYQTTPAGYAGLRLLSLLLGAAVGLWLWLGGTPRPLAVLLIAVVLAAAWLVPPMELERRRTARLARVDRGLAELIDFIVVTVEAGIALGSALNAAATRFKAPLGDELRLMVQERRMGLSTEDALRNLLARCDTPMMRSFVRSVLQAEMLGVSVGQIMRGLAIEMRSQRRQAAEEQAHKAPVKIVFPLAFLIMPPMFLVLLGPAAHGLLRGFGG